MEIINDTKFEAFALPLMGPENNPILAIIIKGTFAFFNETPVSLADEQMPIAFGDELFDEEKAGSIKYESDLAPFKPKADIALVGHDGPHHIAVSEGRPVLRGLTLYHGKRGHGVSVEFQLKNGPITCVGLTQTYGGRFKFVVAEGESIPGPIPPTGNTNTRCKFPPDVGTFIENWSMEGPTHHFALGARQRR